MPKEQNQLATIPSNDIGTLIGKVVDSGITKDSVEVIERMLAMKERMDARDSEREFARAFVDLQTDLPEIPGVRPIPDKQGNVKFCYANFEDIDKIVRPICLRHGFTYAFREGGINDGRVTVIMTLQHSGGHHRDIPYSVRIGSGPPGAGESQADVSGHTYAQRGAIESGLSLRIIGKRDDPRMEGGKIAEKDAQELKDRVEKCRVNKEQFFKYAGATDYADINTSRLEDLQAFLYRAEIKAGIRNADGEFKF